MLTRNMDGQTDRVIPKYKTTTLFAGEGGGGVYIIETFQY